MSRSTKISIFFSDTGGGHRSAAEAIKSGIESVVEEAAPGSLKVAIFTQPIIESSHPFNKRLVSFYNYLARHHTTWIKHFYRVLHTLRPESSGFYLLYRSFLHDLLKQQQPSLIVAVHPMLVYAITRARDEILDQSVKVAVVVTDPNERLWRAWACKRADLIIAPNEAVHRKLLEWGIDPGKIRVLGMPVNPAFLSKPRVSRAKFLSSLGLAPNLYTVCINAGWAGNSHLLDAYAALARCSRRLQVIFLSGYNESLYQKAMQKAQETGIPTVVLPFYDHMPDLMHAANVMVTKAGGLTTFEALARRLPLVLDNTIEPMPQEAPTMEMLVSCGMGRRLDHPCDLPKIIDAMPIGRRLARSLPATCELNLTEDGVFQIAEAILALQFPEMFGTPSIEEEEVA